MKALQKKIPQRNYTVPLLLQNLSNKIGLEHAEPQCSFKPSPEMNFTKF